MSEAASNSVSRKVKAGLCAATALAGLWTVALPVGIAIAQSDLGIGSDVSPNAEMLLESDQLIYDNDRNTVTASGNVRIDYDGNRIVAREVSYDRNTGRLMARGDVELVDREGTKVFSQEVDITDDFGDGFVNALRVETTEKTYFGAESATRREGNVTTFNNGVYTACEPCEEQPDKPPLWQVRAQKIVWNGKGKTIRFTNARFELFGLPLAFLPVFETADHTVKRKSGFLFPGFKSKTELGYGVTVPFYLALSPTYDLTLWGTYYSKQGFLGEAEWRQRFDNGEYKIRMAGIRQQDPREFVSRNRIGTIDSGPFAGGVLTDPNELRGMVATSGRFEINPRWTFGWDVLLQSDKNFSNTYEIDGYDARVQRSEIYLTGLNDRNFLDLRLMRFNVQESVFDDRLGARDPRQPWVLPTLDYTYTPDEPIAGGELRFDVNLRSLYRDTLDYSNRSLNLPLGNYGDLQRIRGFEGSSQRLTAEAEWKRQLITLNGLVITPILHLQGDATGASYSGDSLTALNSLVTNLNNSPDYRGPSVASDIRSAYYRYMATAGLDLRWPVLFSTTSASHILEPIGQLFVRPDEGYAGTLGIPNEDAQSMVFDATTLFERDKFSGYDRIEGGTRANVGFRYSGSYANGWTTNAIFGQSYHLAGTNSFNSPDLVNAGAYSGLDTDRSDYVALAGVGSPNGYSFATAARFDKDTFEVRRAELRAGYTTRALTLTARYAFIEQQPLYGFPIDRQEVSLGGSTRFAGNWRAFASGTYDIEQELMVRDKFGFSYDDECFTLILAMSQTRVKSNTGVVDVSRGINFNIAFRTLGEFGSDTASFDP